jgi:gas vesicle protein
MTESRQSQAFMKGVFGGALIGTAVGVLFATEIYAAWRHRQRQLIDAAANVSDAAAERYRDATSKAGDVVDDLQQKGRGVYGKALSVVGRGAEAVTERATDAQNDLQRRTTDATGGTL